MTDRPVTNSLDYTTVMAKAFIVHTGITDNSTGPYTLRWDVVATAGEVEDDEEEDHGLSVVSLVFSLLSFFAVMIFVLHNFVTSRRRNNSSSYDHIDENTSLNK